MDPALFKLMMFINAIQVINTILNVIHKLRIIQGPNAHIAMAILSMISLAGYSGILNTIFLKRKFMFGRIFYMVIAMSAQVAILILSIMSFDKIMTYFEAIAIIHGLVGFITVINFTAAVMVVD